VKFFPENKKVRPRVEKDEVWKKDIVPPNVIWWTVKDRKAPLSRFQGKGKNVPEIDLTDEEFNNILGTCNVFLYIVRKFRNNFIL
jgi:hypothetical protein